MGLNFVIGCHEHRQRVWMFRGEEAVPLHSFYRAHWSCARADKVELTDDQADKDWAWDDPPTGYVDVGESHGVEDGSHPFPAAAWEGTKCKSCGKVHQP